jgi:hypothetical protein
MVTKNAPTHESRSRAATVVPELDVTLNWAHRVLICLFCCALQFSSLFATAASAQLASNNAIEISYLQPNRADFKAYYDGLRDRKVLEDLRLFLSPLLLPRSIRIEMRECAASSLPYMPSGPVYLCYEFLHKLRSLAAGAEAEQSRQREEHITGAFVHYVLNNVSYAIFDVLEVPVWGRKYDAADRLTTFLLLQFGQETANRALGGIVWYLKTSTKRWWLSNFARAEPPDEQRLYNILCIAYGFNPEEFKHHGYDTLLKTHRAFRCEREAEQMVRSFQTIFLPHIDHAQMEIVRSMQWLTPSKH